ncbi:unnamed protein product [Pedinophyceae sp. YPF-701]|nr:unnamed protein product [Pedinophyceae sp. YPF-701]
MEFNLPDDKAEKVVRQVEFYFSDSNLPMDRFLLEQVAAGEDGCVPIETICRFKRMRATLGLKADVTPERVVTAVANALSKSKELKLSEDRKSVGRASELGDVEAKRKDIEERSFVAHPFPYESTIEGLQAWFQSQGQEVLSVRLKRARAPEGGDYFSGVAVVEFASMDAAKAAMAANLHYQGAPLTFETAAAHQERVVEEAKERAALPPLQEPAAGPAARTPALQAGTVLRVDFGDADTAAVSRDAVLEAFGRRDGEDMREFKREKGIAFVEFNGGDSEALVRFQSQGAAESALAAFEGGVLKCGDTEGKVAVLEGEDFDKYCQKVAQLMREKMQQRPGQKRGRDSHGGRGGHHAKRGRR